MKKLYLYYKVDRGFYETAYANWRKKGGKFEDHLLNEFHGLRSLAQEFERNGWDCKVDFRSSLLLPQTLRCYLPLPIAKLLRGALWVTKFDPWLLQLDIIRRIKAHQADVAFFLLGSSIWESTLHRLKTDGVPLAQLCGTPASTMLARDVRNLKYFDVIFQIANLTEGLRAAGATGQIIYTPLGADTKLYHPRQLSMDDFQRYRSDVCFVGGLSNQFHTTRRKLVEYVVKQGINIKVWGGYREHFLDSPILNVWQGQVWGDEQVKVLCASKIGLNLYADHQPGELNQGLNLRSFELAASGVFQLTQRVPSIGEFFEEDKEIVCFDGKEEMLDKIRYYLQHEEQRQAITQAALKRVLRDHTWPKRVDHMSTILEQVSTPTANRDDI